MDITTYYITGLNHWNIQAYMGCMYLIGQQMHKELGIPPSRLGVSCR